MFYFIIGAFVGSFLNVCIHRLPRGESITYPPSHCPGCKHRLSVFDLIPIISYFLLSGRCRYCRQAIAFRYPVVELITGLLFMAVGLSFPFLAFPLEFSFYLIFSCLMIIIFFIDLEHQVIPDVVSVPGIFLGIIFNYLKEIIYPGEKAFVSSLAGLFLGYGLLYLVGRVGKFLFKKEALGEGDLYLISILGAYLGWRGVILSFFMAYLIAGLMIIVLLLSKKVKLGQYVPFGPALASAGILTLFYGEPILKWYLNLFF